MLRIRAIAAIACALVGTGCLTDPSPDTQCADGPPTFKKPFAYGFFVRNYSCDGSDSAVPTMHVNVQSFQEIFNDFANGSTFSSNVSTASDQLRDNVVDPAADAWLNTGAAIQLSYVLNTTALPTDLIAEPLTPNIIRATAGVAMEDMAAVPYRFAHTIVTTDYVQVGAGYSEVPVDCDIEIFEKVQDANGAESSPFFMTAVGSQLLGPRFEMILAHEIGHCLGIEDQVPLWSSGDTKTDHSGVLMWHERALTHNKSAAQSMTQADTDGVLYLYGN